MSVEEQQTIAIVAPELPRAGRSAYPGVAGLVAAGTRSGAEDAATYTAAVYVAQLLLFAAGILQKRLLGPTATGYWSLMATFGVFLNLAPLGAVDGAGRQIPFHRGRGDPSGAAEVADTSSSFGLATTTVAGLVLAGVAITFGAHWNSDLRYGLVLLGLCAPLGELRDAHDGIMQATRRFRVTSVVAVAQAAIALTVQTALVLLFGYYGMFIGQVLIWLGALLIWNRAGLTGLARPAFRWRIDPVRLRELIRFGLPMMLQGQLWALFLAIDNLIVAAFLNVRELGFYALACSATTYIMLLPRGIGGVIGPRMAERFGATRDAGLIGRYGAEAQRLLAYVLVPVLVAAAFYLMPVLIRHGLPAFAPAIGVLRIMVAGSFFISLTTMPIKVLLTSGYRWSVTAVTLVALALNGVANYVAVGVLHDGLRGAAVAVAVSYFTAFALMTGFAQSRTESAWRAARTVLEMAGAFAYLTGALWGIELLIGHSAPGLVADSLLALLKLLLLIVALTPWMWFVEIRCKGMTVLWALAAGAGANVVKRRRDG